MKKFFDRLLCVQEKTPGFTLVEMVAVLVLVGIIGTAFVYTLLYGVRQYTQTTASVALTQKARLALTRTYIEFLEIQGIYNTDNIDATHFYYIDDQGQQAAVVFDQTAEALLLSTGGPDNGVILADTVTACQFSYTRFSNAAWTPAEGLSELATITITLTLEGPDGIPARFTETVNPRQSLVLHAPRMQ